MEQNMSGFQLPAMPSRNGKRSVDMINEQPRKKGRFTRNPFTADQARHGDTWIWLIEVAAQAPERFEGTNKEKKEKIVSALYLDTKADFPLSQAVNLYQNPRWRDMASRWCRSRVGRETLHICQWVWMIGRGIDDFFFSLFDTVLHTLSQLPADAASNVSWNDWKQMSRRLTDEGEKKGEKREGELRQLFYPDHAVGQCINPSTERRPGFLAALDDAAYWEMYDRIPKAPGLRFMNINALIALSLREAKTLRQVMRHVVAWVDPEVEWAKASKRDRDKLVLRKRLIPALKHFDVLSVEMCGTKLKARIARVQERPEAETASIILQQEVLEFVLDNLESFMAKTVVEYLEYGLDNPNGMESNRYAWRFRDPTWAGVLNIVRRYIGVEFKLQWSVAEDEGNQRPMIDGTILQFVNAFCNQIQHAGLLAQHGAFRGKIASGDFKKKLVDFVLDQCKGNPQNDEDMASSRKIFTSSTHLPTRHGYQDAEPDDDWLSDEEIYERHIQATAKKTHPPETPKISEGQKTTMSAVPPSAQGAGLGW